MRSSDSASSTSSASSRSRFWVPSQREYRNWPGMDAYNLTTGLADVLLDFLPRLDVDDGDPRADQLLELRRGAVQGGERPVVHRHDGLHAQQLHRLGGPPRAHRVEVADRE